MRRLKHMATLMKPRLWGFRSKSDAKARRVKLAAIVVFGILFWVGIYWISFRLITYFRAAEDIGDILNNRLLSMVLVTFLSLLLFSSVLTNLTRLYLSQDLKLVHAFPVPPEYIFFSRWLESTLDSSWMVMLYAIPLFIAYGVVYEVGYFYYFNIPLALAPICLSASATSSLAIMLVVLILPASRIRSIFVFLGIGVLVILYITFRMLKPERLVNPDAFQSMAGYILTLSTPSSMFLPTTWAQDSLQAAARSDYFPAISNSALTWSFSIFLMFLSFGLARHLYFPGFSKSQTANIRIYKTQSSMLDRLFCFLPGVVKAFTVKEIKTFWRDQAQWSQLFLLAALMVVYIYNFSVLPIERSPMPTVYIQNALSFLNMALTAFVLTAVCARFAFPSVSIESSAIWIVRASPVDIRTFLWIKFAIYLIPMLLIAETLILTTNHLLTVSPFMNILSFLTLLGITPGIIALGVGLGAAYPDFKSENPAQAATSFGGLLFMILSAFFIGLVAILEAGPVYTILMADIKNQHLSNWQLIWCGVSFGMVCMLFIIAIVYPMRFGQKRLYHIITDGE